jgi:hypothetical protein
MLLFAVSCDREPNIGTSVTPGPDYVPPYQVVEEFKEGEHYHIYFTSNGDGTCYISDITTNPNNLEHYTLVIPDSSPRGDVVTKIDIQPFAPLDAPKNVPEIIGEAYFNELLTTLQSKVVTQQDEFDYQKFLSYYRRYDIGEATSEASRNRMIEKYPLCQTMILYAWEGTGEEDKVWASEYLSKQAGFDMKEKLRIYAEMAKPTLENERLNAEKIYQLLGPLYYRGAEKMVKINVPSSVEEVVGDPFVNCTDKMPTNGGEWEEYADVRVGMTYDEVVSILGAESVTAQLGKPGERCWILEDGRALYLKFETRVSINSGQETAEEKTVVTGIRIDEK